VALEVHGIVDWQAGHIEVPAADSWSEVGLAVNDLVVMMHTVHSCKDHLQAGHKEQEETRIEVVHKAEEHCMALPCPRAGFVEGHTVRALLPVDSCLVGPNKVQQVVHIEDSGWRLEEHWCKQPVG